MVAGFCMIYSQRKVGKKQESLGGSTKPLLTEEEIEDWEVWVRMYDGASEKRCRPGTSGPAACPPLGSQSWGVSREATLGPF